MKIIQSAFFRAIVAIAMGVLLVKDPSGTLKWITILLGVLFLVVGVMSCINYFVRVFQERKEAVEIDEKGRPMRRSAFGKGRSSFPMSSAGSVLFGLVLILRPDLFDEILMYILGAFIIVGAINQFVKLALINRIARVHWLFWVFPIILLIAGVWLIIKPFAVLDTTMYAIGWCLLLLGVVECITAIKDYAASKKITDAEEVVEDAVEVADEAKEVVKEATEVKEEVTEIVVSEEE
ncbi:MAG: DUF308 domain-containing protein [Prevotella sp.]|nr:DUF308 domain-containing protein [Prevotella sp.]